MADFQENLRRFTEQGVRIVAASAETPDEANATVERLNLSYPVGYGLDPEEFASRTGAFYADETTDDSSYLHATGFLLKPTGVVDIAVYSSGAIGRLAAADSLQILEYRLKPNE